VAPPSAAAILGLTRCARLRAQPPVNHGGTLPYPHMNDVLRPYCFPRNTQHPHTYTTILIYESTLGLPTKPAYYCFPCALNLSKGGRHACKYALHFAAGFGSHIAYVLNPVMRGLLGLTRVGVRGVIPRFKYRRSYLGCVRVFSIIYM